jgi:hypothetical protein
MPNANAEELREHGVTVIEGVIPADDIHGVRDRVRADILANNDTDTPALGKTSNLLRINQDLAPFMAEPRLIAALDATLGAGFRVSFFTGFVTGPGRARDIWHADWPYNQRHNTRIPAPYPDIALHLTSFWMLTDFTVENGATIVVPGSHKLGDHPRDGGPYGEALDPRDDEERLLGTAGSVAIVDSRIWHAVAPNVTDEDRVAVVVRYAAWWLNLNPTRTSSQEYDPAYHRSRIDDLPAEVFAGLPQAVQPQVRHLLPPGVAVPA